MKKAKIDASETAVCERDGHDFFQLTHYSLGQATLQYQPPNGSARLVCRKCGKVIAV
jgi:hypothetical protein